MLSDVVVESMSLPDNKGYAVDIKSNKAIFINEKKDLAYYSQTCGKLGLYTEFEENLIGAKKLFLKSIKRQRKLIYNNTFYKKAERGLYADIIYLDFKHFYQELFIQIADHIDEDYFGKEIKNIVVKKRFLSQPGVMFSESAKEKPLVDIKDIAKNAVKIDINKDKEEIKDLTTRLANADYYDKVDSIVSKVTRNALAFGFGYQQKNASVSNISALVMYFGKKLMELTVNELEARQNKVIFSHTDSFMTNHINTKDLDDSIKFAVEQLNDAYFGGVPILKFDFGSLSIKNKFSELMIINQNAYIYTDRSGEIGLAVAGLNNPKTNGLGVNKNGENLMDILNEHKEELFSKDKEFFKKYENTEFLYSVLKYRLSEDYTNKLVKWWLNGDKEVFRRSVKVNKTIRDLYLLMDK